MPEKIITLSNLEEFKNKCDETYSGGLTIDRLLVPPENLTLVTTNVISGLTQYVGQFISWRINTTSNSFKVYVESVRVGSSGQESYCRLIGCGSSYGYVLYVSKGNGGDITLTHNDMVDMRSEGTKLYKHRVWFNNIYITIISTDSSAYNNNTNLASAITGGKIVSILTDDKINTLAQLEIKYGGIGQVQGFKLYYYAFSYDGTNPSAVLTYIETSAVNTDSVTAL